MRLLVLNWLDRENPLAGGAEHHLHETFSRLLPLGWEVTVVTSGWRGAARRSRLDGLDVRRVGGRLTYPFHVVPEARRLLAEGRYTLVVEDLNKAPLFAPLWSSRPVVLLVHHLFGTTAFREASIPVAAATWALERPIGRAYRDRPVVAVSRSTRQDLIRRGLDPARIEVIENGVDAAGIRPATPDERDPVPTLLSLGRLKRYKRIETILRAVAHLRGEGRTVRLVVAGSGDQETALRREAARLGLGPDTVSFPGYVDEGTKAVLLRAAWVHVVASEKEGWGLSVLEAAAAGTPTVATDVPGLRDSVQPEETGLLVPFDDPKAFAAAVERLLDAPALRERMGQAARRRAERHTWEGAAARWDRFLRAAVASGPPDR